MINIQNVSKTYGQGTKACDQIQLDIRSGEIFGFLGPNGAGKTTLIKMMTGVISMDEGRILLDGVDIMEDPLAAKQRIGYVPDDPNIFLRLKGLEYLNFMADVYRVSEADRVARIEELTQVFSMDDVLADKIQTYSHGMRQKITLIGALMSHPPIWILDEPMTGLDPKAAFQLKQKMREHADQGHTVIFSTHVLDTAEKVCDRVAIIDQGRVRFCGTIPELRRQYTDDATLEAMFLELVASEQQMEVPG